MRPLLRGTHVVTQQVTLCVYCLACLQAERHGVSTIVIGVIISSAPLSVAILSPLVGYIVSQYIDTVSIECGYPIPSGGV